MRGVRGTAHSIALFRIETFPLSIGSSVTEQLDGFGQVASGGARRPQVRDRCLARMRSSGFRHTLGKDTPAHRPVEPPELSEVVALPRRGGLHHRYSRRAP